MLRGCHGALPPAFSLSMPSAAASLKALYCIYRACCLLSYSPRGAGGLWMPPGFQSVLSQHLIECVQKSSSKQPPSQRGANWAIPQAPLSVSEMWLKTNIPDVSSDFKLNHRLSFLQEDGLAQAGRTVSLRGWVFKPLHPLPAASPSEGAVEFFFQPQFLLAK